MRAIYINHIDQNEFINYEGESTHHLLNVVRVQKGEKILLMDGKGLIAESEVEYIQKKKIIFKVLKRKTYPQESRISLAIALPKKEAFHEIYKNCVEMGIKKLIPFESDFSQNTKINYEKLNKIGINALIQSNNPYLTQLEQLCSFEEILKKSKTFDKTFVFSLDDSPMTTFEKNSEYLIIIGPEGGLARGEISEIVKHGAKAIHLPLPILTAPVAACVATGFVLGKIN
ncbi:MAG: 16S rRNA (uracil(1498)-N(3))-methyltransferase [Bdellovibrionales bacterium]|jgi:16S rRNA (uracil1498-N3)-methyltransferase|nr:16S rRNA (uracil(1498)-N(3))-methyltransferase [Bdellovibrionales bacterium]